MSDTTKVHLKNEGKAAIKSSSTCLFNIIIYTDDIKSQEAYQTFLNSLKKKFPCRSIFITEDPSSDEELLKIKVNDEDSPKPQSACDQISIQVTAKTKERSLFLILSYLIADIPTYVIWSKDLKSDDLVLNDLKDIATKIVFDTFITSDLKDFSLELLKHIDRSKSAITDFAWFKGKGWRELLASVFCTQEHIDHLFHAKIIKIKYSSSQLDLSKNYTPAIYLQAWLAAQMNWKVQNVETIEGNTRISYERFLYDTVILLIPEETQDVASGQIISMEIETTDSSHYVLKKLSKDPLVKVWISSKQACDIPYNISLVDATKEQLVIGELFRRGINHHYHNTLKMISQTQWND
jgi:glucose-6-phosphate dehydrogenase assembly protein OpcA